MVSVCLCAPVSGRSGKNSRSTIFSEVSWLKRSPRKWQQLFSFREWWLVWSLFDLFRGASAKGSWWFRCWNLRLESDYFVTGQYFVLISSCPALPQSDDEPTLPRTLPQAPLTWALLPRAQLSSHPDEMRLAKRGRDCSKWQELDFPKDHISRRTKNTPRLAVELRACDWWCEKALIGWRVPSTWIVKGIAICVGTAALHNPDDFSLRLCFAGLQLAFAERTRNAASMEKF